MPAYVVVQIEMTDSKRYETYKQLAPESISQVRRTVPGAGPTGGNARRYLSPEAVCDPPIRFAAKGQGMVQLAGVSRSQATAAGQRSDKDDLRRGP